MKKLRIFAAAMTVALMMTSCSHDVHNIPSGYVGKVLTSTGWKEGIMEAGQVDLGDANNDGTYNSLVLLEATTITVKEQFMIQGADGQDHRMKTRNGMPVAADIYIQIEVPTDQKKRDAIFALITAKQYPNDPKVSVIEIKDLYDRFATQLIRGGARTIVASYENTDSIMRNYSKMSAEIALMANKVVNDSKAPFGIIGVQISNVQEDPTIITSKNKMLQADNEAESIRKIGEAIAKHPQYLESRRLDVLEKIGANGKSSLIVMDTKSSSTIAIPTK